MSIVSSELKELLHTPTTFSSVEYIFIHIGSVPRLTRCLTATQSLTPGEVATFARKTSPFTEGNLDWGEETLTKKRGRNARITML